MAALQCDFCGGSLTAKSGGVCQCDTCGMKFDRNWVMEKLQAQKNTPAKEPADRVEDLLRQGWSALEAGSQTESKAAFDRVLELEPENARAHLGRYLGICKISTMSEAEAQYEKLFYDQRSSVSVQRIRKLADPELARWFRKMDDLTEKQIDQRIADAKRRQEKALWDAEDARMERIFSQEKLREQYSKLHNRVVAAGHEHTVYLKADGTVEARGENDFGQCNVSGWRNISAVAAARCATFGLTFDGTVVVTGLHDSTAMVPQWRNITALAVSEYHAVGLKADGTVIASGKIESSLNQGQYNVRDWTNIVAIAAGKAHTVGLKADGTVVAVGNQEHGRCDVGSWRDIVAIAAGPYHTVGLKSDGTVVAAGWDIKDQCKVDKWENVILIAAGAHGTTAITADNKVYGRGYYFSSSELKSPFVAVTVSENHTVFIHADGSATAGKHLVGSGVMNDLKSGTYCGTGMLKLFNSAETFEQEREDHRRRIAEEKRRERIATLKAAKESLSLELANLRGLFSGRRRREIETRLPEIEAELKRLSQQDSEV